MIRVASSAMALALVAGCRASTFLCQTDAQCGGTGRCEGNGSCSFPDETCDSGRRYGTYAAEPETCVPVEEGTTEAHTTMPTSIGEGPPVGTSEEGEGSTLPVSASEVGGDTTSGPATTGPDPTDGSSTGEPATPFDFEDDFERPDAEDVGNGWVEKTPAAFSIVDGALRRTSGGTPYPDNLVYRPGEEWLDAEAVLSVTFDMGAPWGHPQLVLRTQPEDIDVEGSVTGYLLFIETDANALMITRQIDGAFTLEEATPLSRNMELGITYRLRLRVTGTDPVQVDGFFDEELGGRWVVHTQVHLTDDTEQRITDPGTLALGAHSELEWWSYEHIGLYDLGQ